VEAGNSSFDTNERKLTLARQIGTRIEEYLAARTNSP